MKWEQKLKTPKYKAIMEYRATNPKLSLKEVGLVFGLTKQRISQILSKEL